MIGKVVEATLSASLQVIFQSIASVILDELHLIHESKEELRILTDEVLMLQAYLRDAAQKQQTNEAVRLWLGNLQDVAYDANNLLDECALEAQRQRVIQLAQVRNSLSQINPKRALFLHKISRRVRNMMSRIEVIKRQRLYYGLEPERSAATNTSNAANETTSLELPFVLEREGDKRKIIDLLLSSDVAGQSNTSVVCIVGIGGLGKTTLARTVFNDELVSQNFTVRSWVHVSHDFKEEKLTKAILMSIDGLSQDSVSLDHLQKELLNKLREKRFLLVLDDVWIEDWRQWQRFRIPLLQGSMGSKILVTTRSIDVAEAMCASTIHHLQPLGDDDCWCLFSHYMEQFSNHMPQQISTNDLSELESLSVEIAQKCNGLPSAAADLAFRLRQEPDRRRWRSILQTERIESSYQNSDSSRAYLSYEMLPAHLKPCFAFCSAFPKGFEFEKEELVQLWMSQNFIQPIDDQRMEDVGSKYFDFLERRSLFQHSRFGQKINRSKHIIHESIYNYARHASRGDYSIAEPGKKTVKARHISLMCPEAATDLNIASSTNQTNQLSNLYTLVVFGNSITELPDDFTKKLESLRALDLSNTALEKLPCSIDCLKHLRYLQLKGTKIRRLPDALTSLYFLQTLGLGNCYLLEELPKDIKYLLNLRHIDLQWDEDSMMMATQGDLSRSPLRTQHSLRIMPPEIGLLTHLQTLSRFVVGDKSGCGLGELKNLNHLHGELLVSNLHLVRYAEEARLANLRSKQHLQHLELHWDDVQKKALKLYRRKNAECILSELQPHSNLKGLRIAGYMGASFPCWIWSSLLNLTTLTLINCRQCPSLPPLGNLPLLTELHIEGMDAVQNLSCAFCGEGSPMPFRALKKLCLENMPNLQRWSGDKKCALHSLRELVITHCSSIQEISHSIFSLEKLVIEGSPRWSGLPNFPSLTSIHSLCLKGLAAKSLPVGLLRGYNSLKRLEVSYCAELEGFPEDWPPTSLVYFGVKHCHVLRRLPNGLEKLRFLEDMEIENCPLLSCLPDEVGLLNSLVRLEISACPWLFYLPSSLPVRLHILSISNCPSLKERCKRGGEDWTKIKDIFSVWIDGEMVISPLSRGSFL